MGEARIVKDTEHDPLTTYDHRRWRIDLPWGGRKFTGTRREAIEWCDEKGIPWKVES